MFSQLTHVKTKYSLTSARDHTVGSSLELLTYVFEVDH